MSLFRRQQKRLFGISSGAGLIPSRTSSSSAPAQVTPETALRHSAVWAACRLRAGLISTFPIDVYRMVGDIQVDAIKPPILYAPGGAEMDYVDWMQATQFDLDRYGNTIGIITEWNAWALPAKIELQAMSSCSVIQRHGEPLRYRIGNRDYDAGGIYHERQYVVSGLPVGLSPVAYAAWSIGQFQSAQSFAEEWYGSGGIPKAHLRNTEVTVIGPDVAAAAKERFKASVDGRDIWVTGKDWEYRPIQAEAVGSEWLDAQKWGVSDVARFFDVPGDLIDAGQSQANITYANITQRNLQFLILNLMPAIVRREKNLTKIIPQPRFVKLNTDALLRMDPLTRAQSIDMRIKSRTLTPTEARALENQPPLTAAQVEEFTTLFGPPPGSVPRVGVSGPVLPGATPVDPAVIDPGADPMMPGGTA